MWYALLPPIVMFVILIVMHGIKWGCEALGLGEITSIFLAILFLIYVFLVVVFYK